MSDCGDSLPASGVTTPTTRARIEALTREELIQRCRSLLSIAHKAKVAKDDAVKQAEVLRQALISNESSQDANLQTLKAEKNDLDEQLSRLQSQLEEDLLPFKQMAETFKVRWREAVEELAALRALTERGDATQAALERMVAGLEEVRQGRAELERRLETELRQRDQAVRQLASQLTALEAALQTDKLELQQRGAQLLEEMNAMNETLKERGGAISQLEELLAVARRETEQRQETLSALEADNGRLKEMTDAAEKENGTLREALDGVQIESRKKDLKLEQLQSAGTRADDLASERDQLDGQVSALNRTIENNKVEISEIIARSDAMEKKVNGLEAQISELIEQNHAFKTKAHELEVQVNELTEQNDAFKTKARDLEVQASELTEQNDAFKTKARELEVQANELTEQNDAFKTKARELEVQVNELTEQNDSLKKEAHEFEVLCTDLKARSADQEERIGVLQAKANGLERDNNAFNDNREQLVKETDAKVADLNAQNMALKFKIQELEEQAEHIKIKAMENGEQNGIHGHSLEASKEGKRLDAEAEDGDVGDVTVGTHLDGSGEAVTGEEPLEVQRVATVCQPAPRAAAEATDAAAGVEHGGAPEARQVELETENRVLLAQLDDVQRENRCLMSELNTLKLNSSASTRLEQVEEENRALQAKLKAQDVADARQDGSEGLCASLSDPLNRPADQERCEEELRLRVQSLQTELEEVSGERDRLQSRLAEVEAEMRSKEVKQADLEAQVSSLERQYSVVRDENETRKVQAQELEKPNDALQSRIEKLQDANHALESKLLELRDQKAAVDRREAEVLEERDALKELLARMESEFADTKRCLVEAEGESGSLRGRVAELESELLGVQTRLAEAEEGSGSLRGRVAELELELLAVQTRLTEAEGESGSLRGRVAELEPELLAVQARLTEAEGESGSLRGRVAELEPELLAVQARLAEAEGESGSLRERVAELEPELLAVQTRLAEAEGESGSLRGRVAELEPELLAVQARLAKAEGESGSLRERVAELTNRPPRAEDTESGSLRVKADESGTGSRLDLSETQSEALSTSTALSRADDLSRMRDVEDSIEERYHKLRALAVKLKKKVVQLTNQSAAEAEARQKAQGELSQLTGQLSTSKKEAAALRVQAQNLQALQASYDRLQDQVDSLTSSDRDLRNELTRAGEQLSQLKLELCETQELKSAAEARAQSLTESGAELEALELERDQRSADDRQREQLQLSAEQLRGELTHAQAELAEARRQLQHLGDEHQTAEQQLQLATEELQLEQGRVGQLKASLRDAMASREALEAREVERQRAADDLKRDVETLKQEKEALNLALSEAARSSTGLSQTQNALRRQVEALESQVTSLQDALSTARADQEALRQEFDQYKVNVRAKAVLKKAQMSKKAEADEDEREALRSKEERIEALQREVEQLRCDTGGSHVCQSVALKRLAEDARRAETGWRQQFEKARSELTKRAEQQEETIRALRLQLSSAETSQTTQEQLQSVKTRLTEEVSSLRAELRDRQDELATLRRAAKGHQAHHKLPPSPIDVTSMEREAAEGSENVTPQPAPARDADFVPLERLLSSADDSASTVSHATELTSTERDRLVAVEGELAASRLTEQHLSALLNESEAGNAKLTQLCDALKEEIRRSERSEERQKHLNQMEYLKNIIVKFLTLKEGDERSRLVPVLSTMLRLSPQEVTQITQVAAGEAAGAGGGRDQGWASYLHLWSGGPQ
ncbi:GRIP and coiled-coil domain-containing protein 2-like [Pollicipes pollicipes]|uniref:GRIP and coiled-coil domain-containing protein 2-like n=1 Tax=Pollicipes pollicipes TaxID=41117 RepID=UPI00188576A6|nr:GRIP and coiled-coil domain-containing protein 2-like [Pollicipes pollicipes]